MQTDEVTHTISELVLGCHADVCMHGPRMFASQLLYGDSFNASGAGVWNVEAPAGAVFATGQDSDASALFHGVPSQRLRYVSGGPGSAGLSNRGLANAGLAFEGYIFARPGGGGVHAGSVAPGPVSVSLTVSLEDYVTRNTLASTTLRLAGSGFQRYNFSLTPTAATGCVDIVPGSDPAIDCGMNVTTVGHTCVRCAGQFKLSMAVPAPGTVLVNFVLLQPGPWGRVAGLPVLRSAAAALSAMGVKAIRYGGSFGSTPARCVAQRRLE
eukprot:SAG22_NODE_138_length_18031_cov_5.796621_3_plen_268_part_00